jgi:hypothetical protein
VCQDVPDDLPVDEGVELDVVGSVFVWAPPDLEDEAL